MRPNIDSLHVRKWYSFVEEIMSNENRHEADGNPIKKLAVAACVHNPYAGRYSDNLDDIINPSAALGVAIGERMLALAGGAEIDSYGKGIVVGSAGEYEHGNAFITNIGAGPVRDAVGGGKAWVPSTGKRGGLGVSIDVPLAHKNALYVRSHYDSMTVSFSDSPMPDEVLVVWAFATRGRLHARLGGLTADEINGEDGLR
jgi:hypothetical protein